MSRHSYGGSGADYISLYTWRWRHQKDPDPVLEYYDIAPTDVQFPGMEIRPAKTSPYYKRPVYEPDTDPSGTVVQ